MRLPPHVAVDGVEALHPALLDACLHVYPALIEDYGNFEQAPQALRHTYLPIGVERFRSNRPGAREVWAHAVRRSAQDDPQTVTIDIAVYREDGSRAATLEGLSLRQLSPQALAPGADQGRPDWLYLLQWVERPQLKGPPAQRTPDEPSAWLILADQGGVGVALAGKLADRGDMCRLVSVADVVGHDSMCAWSPDDLVKPFAALLAESTKRSVPLRGVIDLWPLDVTTGFMSASELQDFAEDRHRSRACAISGHGRSAGTSGRRSSHLAGVAQCDPGLARRSAGGGGGRRPVGVGAQRRAGASAQLGRSRRSRIGWTIFALQRCRCAAAGDAERRWGRSGRVTGRSQICRAFCSRGRAARGKYPVRYRRPLSDHRRTWRARGRSGQMVGRAARCQASAPRQPARRRGSEHSARAARTRDARRRCRYSQGRCDQRTGCSRSAGVDRAIGSAAQGSLSLRRIAR